MSDFKETQHGRNHRVGGSDPIPGLADGGARIVRGALYNDANIIEGTGFTAEWNDADLSHSGENLITIRFDESFASPGPIVALTPNNNNPADVTGEYAVTLKTRNVAYIVVEGKEFDGTASIGGFDFLAIEAAA